MKAPATLKNVASEACKPIIVRNLNRILDILIIDIDVERGILYFLYNSEKALESVKKELCRIGCPIKECNNETVLGATGRTGNTHQSSFFMGLARRP